MLWRLSVCVGFLLATTTICAGGGPGIPFVENKLQWPAEFRYSAGFQGARVLLSGKRLYFVQYSHEPDGEKGPVLPKTTVSESGHLHRGYAALTTFEIEFEGAANPGLSGLEPEPTLYNYYFGNDPDLWTSAARAYNRVVYEDLYEGVDLHVYSEDNLFKSDWVVHPCADAARIRLVYNGMDDVFLRDGRLNVTTCLGTLTEEAPYAYQIVNGVKRVVRCNYVLLDKTVTFEFPDGYDSNYELVIDPILIFSSYSGSRADNWGNTATPDSKGNLYSGGMVANEFSFPVTAGAYQTTHKGGNWDVGILKYDSVGANLLYVTYLGGNGVETPQSLVVNSKDELLVLGATGSGDFPGTTPGTFKRGAYIQPINAIEYVQGTDIFIARLSPGGGQLLSARYLGGTANDAINFVSGNINLSTGIQSPLGKNYGDQLRGDITVDANDNVFIATSTQSTDFPIVNSGAGAGYHGGTHDAVVAKLAPDLSTIIWSRLIGGSFTDVAYSIKIGKDNRIYVAGGTTSTDLAGMNGLIKIAPGGIDGWIVELKSDGTEIINGTYLGTSAYDQVYFIDISTKGDVLAFGQTKGQYPVNLAGGGFSQPGGGQFLHKLDANLKVTAFSTVFGVSETGFVNPNISPTAFLVNDCDNIYMAGWGGEINSYSANYVGGSTRNLPVTADAYQKVTVRGNDFYMMVLTGSAELVYATYLGGTTSLTHVDGGTSRFDKRGIVYHAVCAGCGGNSDFPAVNVPMSRQQNRSSNCNNAAFKFDLSSLKARIQPNNVKLTAPGTNRVCLPDGIAFENKSIGGERFEWDLGDGTKVTKFEPDTVAHFYRQPGTYVVKLHTIDVSTCIGIDSTYAIVTVYQPAMYVDREREICHGSSLRLEGFGAVSYAWKGEKSGFTSTQQSPLVSPEEDERYFVTMIDATGCTTKDTVNVEVVRQMDLQYEIEKISDCVTRPYVMVTDKSNLKEDESVRISFGDGEFSDAENGVHWYGKDGVYRVGLIGRKGECVYETGEDVTIATIRVPNVITPGDSPDKNDTFRVLLGDSPVPPDALSISLTIFDKWGVEVFKTRSYQDDWSASNVSEGVYYYELSAPGYPTCKGWVHVIK